MKLSTIIIDDEPDATQAIETIVTEFCPDLEILGIFNSPQKAIPEIISLKPDILFLDIEMPHMNGFDLLNCIPDRSFEVIFITAYNQYAVQAFKTCAIDYILKPINISELITAVNKVILSKQDKEKFDDRYNSLLNCLKEIQPKRISIPTTSGNIFITPDDVIRIEADGSYSKFFMTDNTHLVVSKNLKEIYTLFENSSFFRSHKSHIINIKYIKKYSLGSGGEITMKDGSKIQLARRNKEEFLKKISV